MSKDVNMVLDVLEKMNIEYKKFEHQAVFTVEEAKNICNFVEIGFKNLFVKDKRKGKYYLIIMIDTKKADMKSIAKQLGVSGLTFANEEELFRILGLKPGEVTPFGLLNDTDKIVQLVIDEDIEIVEFVSFHPNVNTSTIVLRYSEFKKYLAYVENKVNMIKI